MTAPMMRRLFRALYIFSATILLTELSCCSLPKVKIPFTGGDTVEADPLVPFNVNGTLGSGHTLQFTVYRGVLSPGKMFAGSGMIDNRGILQIKGMSAIKAGGHTALEVVKKIESHFRARAGDGIINVQLEKIEDKQVVTVVGTVQRPSVIQWFTGMNVNNALAYVGGRDLKSLGRAVYITRRGQRKLHANPTSGEDIALEPGDIVSYSNDL
jgi:protein involved in polysaccharide export with SLBB domain